MPLSSAARRTKARCSEQGRTTWPLYSGGPADRCRKLADPKARDHIFAQFKRDPGAIEIDDLLSAQEYFTLAAEHRGDSEDDDGREALAEELGAELQTWWSLAESFASVADRRAAAGALRELGVACEALERDEAQECYRRALQIYEDLGERGGQDQVLADLTRLEPSRPADAIQRHLQGEVPEADRPAVLALLRDYLSDLWTRLSPLPLLAFSDAVIGREDLPLTAVYTALDVEAVVSLEESDAKAARRPTAGAAGGRIFQGDARYLRNLQARLRREVADLEGPRRRRVARDEDSYGESYSRRLTAVEALAASRRLVLVGLPGSGKSTLARYLALCFAGETLGREEANLRRLNGISGSDEMPKAALLPWPHGAPVPVFIELRRFVASPQFPAAGVKGQASHLFDFIEASPRELPGGPAGGSLRKALTALFTLPEGGLLILDGLDETPAAEVSRERLRQVIASFAKRFPKSRILVTSRPYAYADKSPWRLDRPRFAVATLAPFDDGQMRGFIDAWYSHLESRRQIDAERAERSRGNLWQAIHANSYLRPLAERPLMLTMMVDLHATGGGLLPAGRAELYERSVVLLLDRWNEVRGVVGVRSISDELGVAVPQIRRALEELAFTVHRDRGEVGSEEAAPITADEVWEALIRELHPSHGSDLTRLRSRLMDSLHQRSGILLGESPTRYRFPHRSFEEFLGACYLVRSRFPALLCSLVVADPGLWRETLLLAAGKVAPTPYAAWALLAGLVPDPPGVAIKDDDPLFVLALFAALAVEESGLWRQVEREHAEKLERIRLWLERTVELGALPPLDRAAAGRVLGILGDRRKGVGLRADGAPDMDWVEVPAGPFVMGSGDEDKSAWDDEKLQRKIDLPAFAISRFPVTNAQFAAFTLDGGYEADVYWTDAGRKWKDDGKITGPDDQLPGVYLLANSPRVNASWYEAHAYCEWLSKRLGLEVWLPTEEQWEKAARGDDGRLYPWGNRFDAAKCNCAETGIGRPSAVGMFPDGASPFSALDMSGNVLEWCRTKWQASYQKSADDDAEGVASRVLRGGAFPFDPRDLRCAYRYDGDPDYRSSYIGFRVAAPSSVLNP